MTTFLSETTTTASLYSMSRLAEKRALDPATRDTVNYKKFLKNMEKVMSAVTFAEHGEFETARDFLGTKNSNKRVLLGIEETDVNPKLLQYALNLCRRVGARLEILHYLKAKDRQAPQVATQPPRSHTMRNGIEYTLITGAGALEEKLASRARENRDIIFIVLGSKQRSSAGKKRRLDRERHRILEKTNCPVVVFSDPVEN